AGMVRGPVLVTAAPLSRSCVEHRGPRSTPARKNFREFPAVLLPGREPETGDLTEGEKGGGRAAAERFRATGSGYAAIQSTRPQALAYGLTDSPVGPAGLHGGEVRRMDRRRAPDEAVD